MKTSNKLLIAMALIIISYCVADAIALKAEYLKGDFKKPYYGMKPVHIDNFSAINNNAVSAINLTIEYGDKYAIWVDDKLADDLVFTLNNNVLNISRKIIAKPDYPHNVHVICPRIDRLTCGVKTAETLIHYTTTVIRNFKQDSLYIQLNNNSALNFQSNVIGFLNASVKFGNLNINAENVIGMAKFEVLNQSELTIENASIENATYKCSENAKVSLIGKALNLLPKP